MFLALPDIMIAIRYLYSAAEIVTRLLGQLKIDAGLVNHVKATTSVDCVSTIFTSTISVPAGYCQ